MMIGNLANELQITMQLSCEQILHDDARTCMCVCVDVTPVPRRNLHVTSMTNVWDYVHQRCECA